MKVLVCLWATIVGVLLEGALADRCGQLADDQYDCDFYSECMEANSHCGPTGYALGYGNKYCRRFAETSHLFTPAGQVWISRVRRCLKVALYTSGVYKYHDCDRIREAAFASHPKCYVDNGFCEIATKNIRALKKTLDVKDMFSVLALEQVKDTLSLCLKDGVKKLREEL